MDLARYLPLSQRGRDDESGVTGDRRVELAALVRGAQRLATIADASQRDDLARAFAGDAGLLALASRPDFSASDLDGLAAQIEAGPRRKIPDLQRTVRALLQLADAVGGDARVAPLTLGAVALQASITAPFDRRAAISGHTVVAVDADWSIGRGPELRGSAEGIVRFLLGLSDIPPRAPGRDEPSDATPRPADDPRDLG
ncbi:hypothetical protein Q9R08_00610 [Microbacterium sp. QXD-8]|uniref:DUF222 domain-containing protein n=1 Tax=Microbacterium psychrotolerans TaxID=3068321 RepID=A0ABU0YYX2_9MICO|nr:hypothetical protein [Microbacterium sp. QXD-8]MDQ7876466.1 hypothetical protein [Microbacterium sp. QXD-8]